MAAENVKEDQWKADQSGQTVQHSHGGIDITDTNCAQLTLVVCIMF